MSGHTPWSEIKRKGDPSDPERRARIEAHKGELMEEMAQFADGLMEASAELDHQIGQLEDQGDDTFTVTRAEHDRYFAASGTEVGHFMQAGIYWQRRAEGFQEALEEIGLSSRTAAYVKKLARDALEVTDG